jgi:tetratricopeptide (TPR) repeat protein
MGSKFGKSASCERIFSMVKCFQYDKAKVDWKGAKKLKRVGKIILFGVCLGIVLIFVQRGLAIDEGQFMRGYWVIAPLLVLGAVLVNALYNLFYQHKMRKLLALLPEGKVEEYIAGMEALLQTAKGGALRSVLTINLAAGYSRAKRYQEALALLEPLSQNPLPGNEVRACCRVNLCGNYFYTGQYDKAMELYHDSQTLFAPYRAHKNYGGHIAELDILAAIQQKQYEQAETLLDEARKVWDEPYLQEIFGVIHETLENRKTFSQKL